MTKNEGNYLLEGSRLKYPESTLHELLKERAAFSKNAIALQFGKEFVTYGELQIRINQTANYLWAKGIRPGHIVAISLERTPDLIVSLFAILQCGAAYLPIDINYPDSRIAFMMADSKAEFFINTTSKKTVSHSAINIFIEDILKIKRNLSVEPISLQVSAKSMAYIIYTSGSTGKPKAVQVTHRNLVNLLFSLNINPGINPEDKIFAHTTISFDAMITEIYFPLIFGACIVFVDEETKRDGRLLLKQAIEDKITIMFGTPSLWRILLDSGWEKPLNIKALIGGEPVTLPLAQKLLSRCRELWNLYGPTETTVWSLLTRISREDDLITIGKPISNTHVYLLDEDGNSVANGEIGEITIGGDGVSLGYLNRPELTAEHFVPDPYNQNGDSKMYLSGDLGKLLPNGKIQCLGRKDEQVKLRGNRIELGEIEAILGTLQNIKRAAVIVSDQLMGEPQLVAYIQSENSNLDVETIQNQLAEILPDFMIPSVYLWIKEFPITINGKLNKKGLPSPEFKRPDSAPLLRKPRTQVEKDLLIIWKDQLKLSSLGVDDNFFNMGGTSLIVQRLVAQIGQGLNIEIPVTKIYQYPTIAELAKYIEQGEKFENYKEPEESKASTKSGDIAVIGMAGRFPGANSIEELWDILRDGKETISFFKPGELDPTIPESLSNDPLYVKARGIVPSVKEFDASFFGLTPKVASAMDPQQRLFLEIAWEALEQAGHLPSHYKGSIGVYAGTGTNTYYINNLLPNKELLDQVGHFQTNILNEKDYIASRTAYHLNLKGPAVNIQSACSTSLLAVADAVEAIRNGHCDIALAGGSSITAPIYSGHLYEEGSMLSPDGHCRSFDAEGKGTVFSDGAGLVLLKSLDVAQIDGDKIYGIIKGIGINNDGGNKGSFTAPSAEGQAGCISKALHDAQISPSTISYVETHGTATPLGDPIEMEGLKIAFGEQNHKAYCAIGSIKSNMGHLTAAAGVAGLIKTILALHYKQIPPSLGYSVSNPVIDFENSPFFVNKNLRDWNGDGPRRAGISSFGVGGTNVHVVVEEYENNLQPPKYERPLQLLAWSAKNEISLKAYGIALGNHIEMTPSIKLADVAYTLNVKRGNFNHRKFILANNADNAVQVLKAKVNNLGHKSRLEVVPNEVVFLFPGQGAQYLQMGRMLYENENIFRESIDKCAELLMDVLKLDIRQILFPDKITNETEAKLKNTRYTQPALFIIEYALAKLWMSWGIKPTVLCGHSIGEFVASHLAGIFDLKDSLRLIAMRGRLVSELPTGSMLSVRMAAEKVEKLLPVTLDIAAINADFLCVVSGPDEEIAEFAKIIKEKDILHRLLSTSHAFHSAMMDPVLKSFEEEVEKIKLNPPKLPVISTVTGKQLTANEAINPKYWTNHLRETVRFSDAMDTMLMLEDPVLLEVGPGQALITLARQKKAARSTTTLTSLPEPKSDKDDYSVLLNTLGQLWLKGLEPDWPAFYDGQSRQQVWLPNYVFDRKPCWVNPPKTFESEQISYSNEPVEKFSEKENNNNQVMRKTILLQKISEIIMNISGLELEESDFNSNFLEFGLDSLILTQMALTLKKEFKVPITFRQLNEDYGTPEFLADYLDQCLPAEMYSPKNENAVSQSLETKIKSIPPNSNLSTDQNQKSAIDLIAEQIKLLSKQIELLQGNGAVSTISKTDEVSIMHPNLTTKQQLGELTTGEKQDHKKPFEESPRTERGSSLKTPPVSGAKLGRDENGNPAWFVVDATQDNGYIKIDI